MSFDSRPATYEHIDKVRGLLLGCAEDLMRRAHDHDRSKLEDPELATFDEFTPKLKDLVYGSDEYKACLEAMGPALAHHYANNSHHPEHFKDGIRGMTLLDVVEMLCDWKAASMRTRNGNLRGSLGLNQKRFGYSEDLQSIFENTLDAGLLG